MATDRLINQTQGEDIIDKLNEIASNVGDIKFGPQVQSSNVVSMTGYAKASTADAISQGDTLNEAIGKLEKKADDNASAVAGKIDKLTGATAGDIATVTATGEIADSTVAIENTLSDSSDAKVPTSKAVGTYVAGRGYAVGVNNSTANHIVAFNSTDGKTLKDSGYTVNTTLTDVATDIPTGSAVSTALAGKVAGPGSSTGNDIMLFSGTTGKVAIDSGVQIEKNTNFSETSDAKIPTSKSIAQNVAGKAVLKNYSVATAQETISASTTLKDAVEQLDYRTTTNQNSISSVQNDVTEINSSLVEVINDGAKNIADFQFSGINPDQSISAGTITYTQSNGEFTFNGSADSSKNYACYLLLKKTIKAGSYVISGCTDGSSTTYRLRVGTGSNDTFLFNVTTEPVELNLSVDTVVTVQFVVQAGTSVSNKKISPMVCTKAAFGVSSKFVPYRPNWDLVCQNIKDVNTVLEAVL